MEQSEHVIKYLVIDLRSFLTIYEDPLPWNEDPVKNHHRIHIIIHRRQRIIMRVIGVHVTYPANDLQILCVKRYRKTDDVIRILVWICRKSRQVDQLISIWNIGADDFRALYDNPLSFASTTCKSSLSLLLAPGDLLIWGVDIACVNAMSFDLQY
jgi:hypothetical protein